MAEADLRSPPSVETEPDIIFLLSDSKCAISFMAMFVLGIGDPS